MRDLGNTVLVGGYDEETIRSADFVVDIVWPPACEAGSVVFAETPKELIADTCPSPASIFRRKKN
ncbi:MAG: hypothetical protein R2860_16775 [Desulfobacterales bacterium]